MAVRVAGIIRLVSALETFQGRGSTIKAVHRAIGPVPLPEGPYGPLRLSICQGMAHSHDQNWGHVVVWGDLWDCGDAGEIETWWRTVIRSLYEQQHMGVSMGVCQVLVDGRPSVIIDHFGVLALGEPLDDGG